MKFGKKLSFGVQAIAAGQKSAIVNATPQLIVNCTLGKFTITGPVSKALNIAVGENVMFLNNFANIEDAIMANREDLVELANEQGWDLNTVEGRNAALAELGTWYIAKGIPQFNSKGQPIEVSERFTKEDKAKWLAENKMSLISSLDEDGRNALLQRLGVADASDEELAAALTVDDVDSPKTQAKFGSKTATSGIGVGVGRQLSFTDSSIWAAMKSDLGENKEKKNRVFDVLLEESQTIPFNDGYKDVELRIYPLEFVEDTDPIQRVKKD